MKISLIILQSLDGFIAQDQNDDLSWGTSADKQFFREFTKKTGTMIMGSRTFEKMPEKAFSDRYSLVLTSDTSKYKDYKNEFGEVEFFNGSPFEAVEYLKTKGKIKIALIGGGKINNAFLKAGVVTDIYITIAPKIFISGIRSFGEEKIDIELDLVDFRKLSQNELLLHYNVR